MLTGNFVALVDKNNQDSYFHTIVQNFVELPQNINVDCTLRGENPCQITAEGDTLNRVSAIFIGSNPSSENSDWTEITQSKIRIATPQTGYSIWLKLRNGVIIKLNDNKIISPEPTPTPNIN